MEFTLWFILVSCHGHGSGVFSYLVWFAPARVSRFTIVPLFKVLFCKWEEKKKIHAPPGYLTCHLAADMPSF